MKLAVIGLDCAAPALVFDRYRGELPNLERLMRQGSWALMRSSHPPITVPAWTCMLSGCDAGQLGIYGFRNRRSYDYGAYAIVDSRTIQQDRIWDVLSRAGLQSIVIGVPPTYPVRPLNGAMISCFLTPSANSPYAFPPELKAEAEAVTGGYVFDAEGFRTDDKAALLERIYQKTGKNFTLARHLARTRPWDFFMMVEMGVDRIHHGFWSFIDPGHRKYRPGNPFEDAVRKYYQYVDREIGMLLDQFPADTEVVVVSDHGAKRIDGGVCINEWLIQNGYLALKETPAQPVPIDRVAIDWTRTRAWGDGGYYGRLFLNVRGREPQGVVEPAAVDGLLEELRQGLEATRPGTKAYRPGELYPRPGGYPPDLIVYFGDLHWRSVGSVGSGSIYSLENDTGPDEANHDWNGIFINGAPRDRVGGDCGTVAIYDIGPTLLARFGLRFDGDGRVGQVRGW